MKLTTKQLLSYCQSNDISLTSQQDLIVKVIANSSTPLTANEILLALRKQNPRANRMTIHRALEFLGKVELIHKVTFNHTYKLCDHLNCAHEHQCQILICQECGKQIELHDMQVAAMLGETGKKYNFIIANPIEITGKCLDCNS